MDYQALKTLIDHFLVEPHEYTDEGIADWCNTPSVVVSRERFVTTRTLMAELGPELTDSILNKLEVAAQNSTLIQRVITMLKPSEGGIDVNLEAVRVQIGGLVPDVLTQGEADAITSLADIQISPALSIGWTMVRPGDVQYVRTL